MSLPCASAPGTGRPGAAPGPPAHTPTGPARQARSARTQSFQYEPESPNARVSALNWRQVHARGEPLAHRLRFSAEKPGGRSRGARGGDADTRTHTPSRLPHARGPPLPLGPPRVQVRAARQPHPAPGVREPGAGAPPRKGPRPQGQPSAQGRRARPAPPRRRPDRHGDGGPGSSGGRGAGGAGGSSPAGRGLARAPPPKAAPPPGRPPARRAGGERRVPGDQPARRPGNSGNFPGGVPSGPGPGQGGHPGWTHFFGCFSLFGLRFRA